MTPHKDPLFHAILSGLLASGMHPDNAMSRALSMYRYLRDTQPPERQPYGRTAAALFLCVLLVLAMAILAVTR